MTLSLAIIFILGILFARIAETLSLPRLLGMLIAGILAGPYVLNLLDKSLLDISQQLRSIALVVILIRAGLSLNIESLKKEGISAALLSFVPATFEIVAYTFLAHIIFSIDYISSAMMGTILAAVSPAVVVPSMLKVMEEGYGNDKSVGQLVLAGASLDDIYVLSLFTSLLSLSQTKEFSFETIVNIPVSIISAILVGIVIGYLIKVLLKYISKDYKFDVIIIFAFSLLLIGLKKSINDIFPFSEMLAVMSFAMSYSWKKEKEEITRIKNSYNGIWYAFECILFVLIGAEVNISYSLFSGPRGLLLITLALIVRSIGVYISLLPSKLDSKEKLFVIISYLPKATVQAAIGAIPLSLGLANGELILSIAVLGILITAPIGAIGINSTYKKLLKKEVR